MDANFTFPRPQAPTPRRLPSQTSSSGGADPVNRESNALRASVLDAALELGIGNNSTFTNWMFNNSLAEEEDEDQRSPALTHGSTATSEELSFSGQHLSASSSHATSNHKPAQAPDVSLFPVPEGRTHFDKSASENAVQPTAGAMQDFPDIPIPPRPVTPAASVRGKLRKKRSDGYESDGGYISDAGKKKKDKDKKKGGAKETNGTVDVEADKKERAREAKIRAKEEKLQEKLAKEEERKRKKSMSKAKKNQSEDKDGYTTGYETDGAPSKGTKSSKKSKSKTSGEAGNETDSGYLSSTSAKAKSKSRFFRLGSKQSKPDLRQEEVPAMPTTVIEKEIVPLPIASRFATTFGSLPGSASASVNSTNSQAMDPPLMSPPVPSPAVSAPATTPLYSPTSPTAAVPDHRESYGSAESGASSSGTSHSKWREFQFFGQDNGHGNGVGSYPTVTSSSQVPRPPSLVSSPASPTKTFPAISFPLTRTPSLSTQGDHPPVSSPVELSSKQLSPSSTPASPHQALSPPGISTSRNPSPIPGPNISRSQTQLRPATSPSTTSATATPRLRPRFPPTDGFGPRLTPSPNPSVIPPSPSPLLRSASPNPHTNHPNPHPRPLLTIVPSSDYIVPSPRASLLPSPNVLAYYDIPPPSPPPAGPLPRVPPPGSFARTPTQERRASSGGMGSISRSRTPEQGLFAQPIPSIQRGREAPFPARPILPSAVQASGVGPGLEERVKVPQYRGLYGLPLPRDQGQQDRRTTRNWERRESDLGMGIEVVEPSDGGWEEVEYDDLDEDEDDLRGVLDRFEEARIGVGRSRQDGKALGRSRSSEALRSRLSDHDRGDDSDSEYLEEEDGDEAGKKSSTEEGGGDRNSRWSGSIYSRVSVLDPEKSEEARLRFVKRVEAMYGDGGREKVIPPVPKIPDAFATPGRNWNRF